MPMPSLPEVLRDRTKQFAIRIVRLFRHLPKTDEARVFGRQVLRSGTSAPPNYRAVCRAKSPPDFVSKMGTVVEEADETLLWLELFEEAEVFPAEELKDLKREADELRRMLSSSLGTARHETAR